jgi:hypothetical protein
MRCVDALPGVVLERERREDTRYKQTESVLEGCSCVDTQYTTDVYTCQCQYVGI